MSEATRIRATVKDGITEVIIRMAHPMESGQRRAPSGERLPPHHITDFAVHHGERQVLGGQFGGGISANPHLVFRFRGGAAGEELSVSWTDNRGVTRTDSVKIG